VSVVGGPLVGLRVVDLTQVLSGPYCTMLFADLGADVVKIEPPAGDVSRAWGPHVVTTGDPPPDGGYGGYFASVNRNKRSVCLDLKDHGGRDSLLGLLAEADVLVENFRVGVMERLELSYEDLHVRFPKLVYGSLRGFGDPRTGSSPYAEWPAFDIIAQAMGGTMGVTGQDAQHPVKVGPGVGDIFPAVLSAVGILAAVREADRTGCGQLVDVAMYDGVLALSERIVYQESITGVSPEPQGNTHPLLCPYGMVRTADGFVTIAAPSDHHWQLLAGIIGRPDVADGPLATNEARVERAAEVYRLVEEWTTQLSTDEVVRRLGGRVPCGPVNTAADIARDPHVAARDMVVEVEHPHGRSLRIVGTPIKLSETPPGHFRRAPLLGEHTAAVLADGFAQRPLEDRTTP
jgi:crotonobetainyl-CoA:carnitine CoA-transferase CaiB-like acyl-CoA transferase